MLHPIYLDELLWRIFPVEDAIIAEMKSAKAFEVGGQTVQGMVNYRLGVLSEPSDLTNNTFTNLGVQ